MEDLILELKKEIIEVLNLEGMTPADIDENAPLFGAEGLGLDSIDALELIVLMEKNYGIKLQDPNQGKEIFKSISVMADYISNIYIVDAKSFNVKFGFNLLIGNGGARHVYDD